MTLDALIEAILFERPEPIDVSELSSILDRDKGEVEDALSTLENKLHGRGIVMVRTDTKITLATAPDAAPYIEKYTEEDYARGLGKAAMETLALILYRGPISKPEIDYIRGVNASSVLRTLLMRGLIEKSTQGERSPHYSATTDALQFLGITRKEDLPKYEEVIAEIQTFEKQEAQP